MLKRSDANLLIEPKVIDRWISYCGDFFRLWREEK